MAAYAALTSLMYILEQIQNHPRPPITLEKQHMDSLCENISFLQDFLENYSHGVGCSEAYALLETQIGVGCSEAYALLETQIADAAYEAEDIIESHLMDQILPKSNFHEENNCIDLFCRCAKKVFRIFAGSPSHLTDQVLTGEQERLSSSLFCQDLQKVIQNMNLIKKEVIEFQEKIRTMNDDQLPRDIISMSTNIIGSSIVPAPTSKNTNTMVGFDDLLIEIMDRLTGHPSNLQILPICGMGGIGKTTLARNVYDHPTIVQHFHIHVWITISQQYRLGEILTEALSCLSKTDRNDENRSKNELGGQLYKSLYDRRYLIILDDMWSIEAWEELKLFFGDNDNGSRIMITTRLSNVADYFESCAFKLNFLDEDKSWKLFCKSVFPQDQCCPLELLEIGKKIAINCKGLPLSIVVIGGLLANSEKTRRHWEYVVENLYTIINLEDDQHCLKILSLSYNHLPVHLKPCFLYMGVFPEDDKINVSMLIKLWIAEGFLKPIVAKSLEVVAEEYLMDLIGRNLILVHKWGSGGKVKFCKMHDLLRDQCLRESQIDKFLRVWTVHDFDILKGICSLRRIRICRSSSKEKCQLDNAMFALPFMSSPARTLISDCKCYSLSNSFRLLRVFSSVGKFLKIGKKIADVYPLKAMFQLVNSRYLAFGADWKLNSLFPSSIHQLWNLQTLIMKGGWTKLTAPPEIWEMTQLRHLEFDFLFLPDPPSIPFQEGDDDFILRNLQTLSGILNFRLTEEVIKRIPNIKKLKLKYVDFPEGWGHYYCLNNLGCLNQLESLVCMFLLEENPNHRIELLQNLAFPCSLKKLSLDGSCLHWEDMTMIGSLPHLQVLKLKRRSFCGLEWNPVEGEFLCLKFLRIECSNLVYWTADSTHFPRLERIVLEQLDKLKEIPLDIGETPLQSIKLIYCSESAVISAKHIVEEQENLGNVGLQVRVFLDRENTEMESLASDNFQVQIHWETKFFIDVLRSVNLETNHNDHQQSLQK